jgi:transcriptional regulator with XRE-family HTH domain
MNRIRLASITRGLYGRVAKKLGVDPSYVSRVARGKRRSVKIEALLESEYSKILARVKRRPKC